MFRRTIHLILKPWLRHLAFCCALLGAFILGFASKGGGGDKKNGGHKDFTPVRSLSDFTLKSTVTYSGALSLSRDRDANKLSVNSFMTFQKGNSIFIMPYKYKVNSGAFNSSGASKSNLQLVGVKIRIPK